MEGAQGRTSARMPRFWVLLCGANSADLTPLLACLLCFAPSRSMRGRTHMNVPY